MLTANRIRRDYRQAGALHALLAPWAFVDDSTFLTKAGHLGLVYRVAGADYECLDHTQRRDVVHRCETALRGLDERCRLYQYVLKRRIPPIEVPRCSHPVAREALQRRATYLNARAGRLYEIELFMSLVYEGLRGRTSTAFNFQSFVHAPRRTLREWLSARHVATLIDADLEQAIAELHDRARTFETQLADTLRPQRLPKADAFRFFRRLVNYDAQIAASGTLIYDTHVDYFMADTAVECHRGHLQLDRVRVKVLTAKEPPAATSPLILEGLYAIPGEFVACLEWQRIAIDRMRRDLRSRQRHFFNKRVSVLNYVSREQRPEQEMLVDESASATVRQLGDALTEMEAHGRVFGEFSLTVVLYDEDPVALDRAVAEATTVLTTRDAAVTRETYNVLNAWISIVPGNNAFNLRRLAILDTNLADLSFLFTLDRGQSSCPHLGRESLAIFETQHDTLYHLPLHVDDVGHAVILGATGSGKSFLVNFLITHAQRYNPLTVIFDVGRGYQKLATLFQGSYLRLGLEHSDVRINPFALAPTPDHLNFLHAFVRVLLEGRDGYRLSDAEDREVYDAIANLYVLAPDQRRLFTLASILPRHAAQRLAKWVEGGRYGGLFDHAEDTLSFQPFQVFDLQTMRAFPDLVEPLVFYILHRVRTCMRDPAYMGVLKLCVMDELWWFLQHPELFAFIQDFLKTGRKDNITALLATQTIADVGEGQLLRTVAESCPTKFLLANPGLDVDQYARVFHLNTTELALLRDLIPRRQFLLKRPALAKVLTLSVDSRSYGLYTNTPADNERFNSLLTQYDFADALDRFAAPAA